MFGLSDYMDYEGQKLAERVFQVLIVVFGSVGWMYGYYVQDFKMTLMALGAGFALAAVMTIPPWPVYRRSPLKWAAASPTEEKKKKK